MQAIEGIILKSTSLEEISQLLTIFSKECGLITIVRKNRGKGGQRNFSPLLKVEGEVIISHKDIWKCKDLCAISSYPRLRLDSKRLRLATFIIRALSQVLPLHHKQEVLYGFFEEHLELLASSIYPENISSSFFLKFLQHEGYFHANSHYFTKEENSFISELLSLQYDKDIGKDLSYKIEKLFCNCTGINYTGIRGRE